MKITEILLEAGMGPATLAKHGGVYFDKLIDKIRQGAQLEISPEYTSKFGEKVVADPSEADRLLMAFYPNGKKEKAKTNVSNIVINIADKDQLKNIKLDDGTLIPLGALYKSVDIKGTSYNKGNIAEGILGAAVTAKFIAKNKPIEMKDLVNVLMKLETKSIGSTDSKSIEGVFEDTVSYNKNIDKIKFRLKLSKNEYSPLVISVQVKEKMDPAILTMIRSSITYVNNNKTSIPAAIDKLYKNKKSSTIVIESDGLSNNTNTKADLHVTIDGKIVNLLSIKTNTKQFGQISGMTFDAFNRFSKEIFLLDLTEYKDQFTPAVTDAQKQKNIKTILNLYEKVIGPHMDTFFGKIDEKPASEIKYINHMYDTIVKHTQGDENLELVKLSSGGTPGYSLHKFDHNLLGLMKKIKFVSEVTGTGLNRMVRVKSVATKDKKLEQDLESMGDLFLMARSSVQAGYMRNSIEMGPVLQYLSRIEHSHFEKR